ncbi:CLUMA_CG018223, isoform A [Clunio marinus]|uniref:CLUMA_CG018223, isoform A n=1 Tax=Clunio marinus TaxID=568069 RepID=A0A1J1IY25_9DIPT|nr:CLUMA_CG018223, isoform A [Clunio marinus]
MALQGSVGKDNLNISFRLQKKAQFFNVSNDDFQNTSSNIVASASCHGLVFAGSTNPELIVSLLKDLEAANAEVTPPLRKVPLPSRTIHIATNCDSSILAVAVKLNGVPHIQLYSVASFLTPNIQKINEFRLSNDNSDAIQLCWNPVLNSTLAVCTESGLLNVFTLKESGFTFYGIDPNLKAKCCCWSPKGKQIVVGFTNGMLKQFTPELKIAKTIECPAGVIMAGSFDTITIQWLSTFQFAVAFLEHKQGSRPIFHIINAPKGAPPQYISYNDVCYTSSETRPSKIYIQHIMQWNILIVASANAIDISFLRITQTGDLPIWSQEFPNDAYPAELPLTPNTSETFPMSLELDIGCTGRLLQEDMSSYPVMPMLHIMSTYGVLCSFYILNTTPEYVDICSPPRPLNPATLSLFQVPQLSSTTPDQFQKNEILKTPVKADAMFTKPIGHSTPTVPKIMPMTTSNMNLPILAAAPIVATTTPKLNISSVFQNVTAPAINLTSSLAMTTTTAPPPPPATTTSVYKPPSALITLPQTMQIQPQVNLQQKPDINVSAHVSTAEDDQIYNRMIQDEIQAFELELKSVMERSRSLKTNIGTREESAEMRKNLEALEELNKEATENIGSLRNDVQLTRLGLTEMFSMFYEAQAKLDQATNEKSLFMNSNQIQDRKTKRAVERLMKEVSQCEMHIQIAVQLMNAQWGDYQDAIKKNKKNRMHNPNLEELYQTLTKQQEIIYRQNDKLNLLKSKLGLRDNFTKQSPSSSTLNPSFEALSDSMISMSIADQVQSETEKLTVKKIKNLRNLLANREVVVIKPKRPELLGLNSEIIQEKKLKAMKVLKERKMAEQKPVKVENKSQDKNPIKVQTSTNIENKNQFMFGTNVKKSEEKTSTSTPTFGFSSTQLVSNVEKKEEPPKFFASPLINTETENTKPQSTISSTNVAVSATFSIPLSNKVAAQKPQKNLSTTFTLKGNSSEESKDETPVVTFKAPVATPQPVPSFMSNTSMAGASKGFSFASKPFEIQNTSSPALPTSNPLSTTSIFGGTGKPLTSSGISSGFSLNLSTDSTKPKILQPTVEPFKTVQNSPQNFSFSALASTIGSSSDNGAKSSGSDSLLSVIQSNNKPNETTSASNTSSNNICSPEIEKKVVAQSPPANIFGGSSPKTESKSIFSSASFGSALSNPLQTSTFETQVSTSSTTSTISNVGTTSSSSDSTASIFGSLSLAKPETTKPAAATSPPSGLFSSLVKPDQSVFSQVTSTTSTTSSAPPFGFFSNAATTQSSNIFGSASPKVTQPGNIFGGAAAQPASSGGIFGSVEVPSTQANVLGQQKSLFGSIESASPSTGSLFSQSSFSSPSTTQSSSIFGAANSATTSAFGDGSIFGGNQSSNQSLFSGSALGRGQSGGSIFGGTPAVAAPSPFGSSSVFGGSSAFGGGLSSNNTQSAFGASSSVFGQQAPTFGGQATFGSPKGNIFGQQASPTQSNNLFEQLGSQESGNLFGSLAQNTQQVQNPPPQSGFSGSAFSSWR